MSWKKYFTPVTVDNNPGTYSPIGSNSSRPGPARANYSSFLPDVSTWVFISTIKSEKFVGKVSE